MSMPRSINTLAYLMIAALSLVFASCSKSPTIEDGKLAYESNDYAKAIKTLTPFAEAGNLEAQLLLGSIYTEWPVKREFDDSKKSFYWYARAADQGNAGAQYHLGFLFNSGTGVDKNIDRAFEYWEKAANQGGWEEQKFIARTAYNEKRYELAAKWYLRLAEQGDADAQSTICSIYIEGTGVHQDFQQANEWCNKAAAKGNQNSLYLLGTIYENGNGVQADPVRAHMYYNLSRASIFSKIALLGLEDKMTKSQILEAQMLARSWTESHKGSH